MTTAELFPLLAAAGPDFDPRPDVSYDTGCETEWLVGLRAGHLSAFDDIYLAIVPALVQFAQRFVSADIAEDVVQDVMIALWERRDRLVVHGTLRGYLFGATRRRIADVRRHAEVVERHANVMQDAAVVDIESAIDAHELDCAVHDALATLPDRARLIVMMRWSDGLSYPEIAEVLEISVEAAKKYGRRTELAIRALLSRFAP